MLVGFMATGKTTVGRIIASETGMPFIDTDDLVVRQRGLSVAEIFTRYGEGEFRRCERQAVAKVSRLRGTVVATGGGVLLDPLSRRRLQASGRLVALVASPEEIAARASRYNGRPLLDTEDRLSRIRRLLAERSPLYAHAELTVDTTGLTPAETAREIVRGLGLRPVEPPADTRGPDTGRRPVSVSLGGRSYDVHIGSGLLARTGYLLRERTVGRKAVIVTHPIVDALYGRDVRAGLEENGFTVDCAYVREGERSKSLSVARSLYDHLAARGVERDCPLLALGGGVVGDLAGFVAATYMRGIPFVQVPTTLLAQVDASIGGKVAVNHPAGKNLVGTFYQPLFVAADLGALRSLPDAEFREGMAEAVKCATIGDRTLFSYLEQHAESILMRRHEHLEYLVRRCARFKARLVEQDERDSGVRMLLNFGHTIGHALESLEGFRRLRHGQAVSLGMVAAARLAAARGLLGAGDLERLVRLLKTFGLPVRSGCYPAEKVLARIRLDKKATAGLARFVLPAGIGRGTVCTDIGRRELENVLKDGT